MSEIPRAPRGLVWAGRAIGAIGASILATWVAHRLAAAARDLLGGLASDAAIGVIETGLSSILALPGVLAALAVGLYGAAAARRHARDEVEVDELATQPAIVTGSVVGVWMILRAPSAAVVLAAATFEPPTLAAGLVGVASGLHFYLGVALLARWLDAGSLRDALHIEGWSSALRAPPPWTAVAAGATAAFGVAAAPCPPRLDTLADVAFVWVGWAFWAGLFAMAARGPSSRRPTPPYNPAQRSGAEPPHRRL